MNESKKASILQNCREAWNRRAERGSPWTTPVSDEDISRAKQGDIDIYLTPGTALPREWYLPLSGKRVLTLASGGGQQTPLLAAAGALVTAVDISDRQLEADLAIADRNGLSVQVIRGNIESLAFSEDGQFDSVFLPVSNNYLPQLDLLWSECARVLKPGGDIFYAFEKPESYLFDDEVDPPKVTRQLPYDESQALSPEEQEADIMAGYALEFSHSWTEQIDLLLRQGFVMLRMLEDGWGRFSDGHNIEKYMKSFICVWMKKNVQG